MAGIDPCNQQAVAVGAPPETAAPTHFFGGDELCGTPGDGRVGWVFARYQPITVGTSDPKLASSVVGHKLAVG